MLEFCNITIHQYRVLKAIVSGAKHVREIEDMLVIERKTVMRAGDKLAQIGAVKIVPCKDPGLAGFGVRIISYKHTRLGLDLLAVLKRVERHRKRSESK